MGDSFLGLNIAVRGLYAAQRNIDIMNHNINNMTTPGYSRQYGVQQATAPMRTYDGTGMVGTGVGVISTERMRDEYLDTKFWTESLSLGEWNVKQTLMADMEAAFNEPSDSGFNKNLGEFFNSLQELSKDPSSGATRALVKEKGITLAKYFNNLASHLEKLQSDTNDSVKIKVNEINSLARQISGLNEQIFRSEYDGNKANDLRDQRTLLIDKLSKLVNIEVNDELNGISSQGLENRKIVITIGGKALVNGKYYNELDIKARKQKKNMYEDVNGLFDISWKDGNSIYIRGGELKGYLDVRDGNDIRSGSYEGKTITDATGLDASITDYIIVDGNRVPLDWDSLNGSVLNGTTVDVNFLKDDHTDATAAEKDQICAQLQAAINVAIERYNVLNPDNVADNITVSLDNLHNTLKVTSTATGPRSSVDFDFSGVALQSAASFYFERHDPADIPYYVVQGSQNDFKGVPYYMKKLNEFVRTFALAFNEGYVDENKNGMYVDGIGHADSYGNGSTTNVLGGEGTRFFTILDSQGFSVSTDAFINGAAVMRDIDNRYRGMTAKNFAVSKDVIDNYNKIAVSDTAGQNGNINNLDDLIEIRHNTRLFVEGGPEDFVKSLVGTLGIDAEMSLNFSKNQQVMVNQVESRRFSISGVSENEEMTNLVKFQHSYNASAKMISTLKEIYDTLINRLGVR